MAEATTTDPAQIEGVGPQNDGTLAVPTRKPYTYWTDDIADKALKLLREIGPHMGVIARGCGISRIVLGDRLKNDADFKERWQTVIEDRNLELEQEARRRAVEGVTRRKYDKDGNLLEEEKVYSDRLMEKLLEAEMPEKFRDRGPFVKDGIGGGVLLIPVVPVQGSVDDLQKSLDQLSTVQRQLEEEGSKTDQ